MQQEVTKPEQQKPEQQEQQAVEETSDISSTSSSETEVEALSDGQSSHNEESTDQIKYEEEPEPLQHIISERRSTVHGADKPKLKLIESEHLENEEHTDPASDHQDPVNDQQPDQASENAAGVRSSQNSKVSTKSSSRNSSAAEEREQPDHTDDGEDQGLQSANAEEIKDSNEEQQQQESEDSDEESSEESDDDMMAKKKGGLEDVAEIRAPNDLHESKSSSDDKSSEIDNAAATFSFQTAQKSDKPLPIQPVPAPAAPQPATAAAPKPVQTVKAPAAANAATTTTYKNRATKKTYKTVNNRTTRKVGPFRTVVKPLGDSDLKNGIVVTNHVPIGPDDTITNVKRRLIKHFNASNKVSYWNLGVCLPQGGGFYSDKTLMNMIPPSASGSLKLVPKATKLNSKKHADIDRMFKALEAKDIKQFTELVKAMSPNKYVECVKNGTPLLIAAIQAGINKEMLVTIVEKFKMITDIRNQASETILIAAMKVKNMELVHYLSERYPDLVTTSDKNTVYPMQHAVLYLGDMQAGKLVEKFKQYGADLDARNSHNKSPLLLACFLEKPLCFYYLLKHGARIRRHELDEIINWCIDTKMNDSIINVLTAMQSDPKYEFSTMLPKLIETLQAKDQTMIASYVMSKFAGYKQSKNGEFIVPKYSGSSSYFVLDSNDLQLRKNILSGKKKFSEHTYQTMKKWKSVNLEVTLDGDGLGEDLINESTAINETEMDLDGTYVNPERDSQSSSFNDNDEADGEQHGENGDEPFNDSEPQEASEAEPAEPKRASKVTTSPLFGEENHNDDDDEAEADGEQHGENVDEPIHDSGSQEASEAKPAELKRKSVVITSRLLGEENHNDEGGEDETIKMKRRSSTMETSESQKKSSGTFEDSETTSSDDDEEDDNNVSKAGNVDGEMKPDVQ